MSQEELIAWEASLIARQEGLRQEEAELMANLDQMDPRFGARVARALAARMDELAEENLRFLQEKRRLQA